MGNFVINQRLDSPSLRPAASSGMTSKVGNVGQKVRGTLTTPKFSIQCDSPVDSSLGILVCGSIKKFLPLLSNLHLWTCCYTALNHQSSVFKVRYVMYVNQMSIKEDTETKSQEDI